MIVKVKLHHIPLLDTDKFPWNVATKGPEDIVHAISEALDHFSHFKIDSDFGGILTCDGWGNQWRIG
jgi:hypothetical protein